MKRGLLLSELELLTHSMRMRRMVEVGRNALSDPAVKGLLDEMARGGLYERVLSLQACYGSRDGSRVLQALGDPSRLMRGLAIRMVVVICDDDQAKRAVAYLPNRAGRKKVIRLLSKYRRFDVVDEALRQMIDQQDEEVRELLSCASGEFIAQYMVSHGQTEAESIEWVRLARFHPQATADWLCRIVESKTERDRSLLAVAGSNVLSELAERIPDRAFELASLWLRHLAPSEINFQRLAERLPQRMTRLVLSRREPFRVQFTRVAERLDTNDVRRLMALRPETLPLEERWFHQRTPAERLSLFKEFHLGWRDATGCLPNWVIALLPRDVRQQESRAHWQHAPLSTRPLVRLPYAACLPWKEAREGLEPFIRNPDAELRAPAIASLVRTIRFDRDCVNELLPFAAARKHEQDPVRMAMLSAIAELPTPLWRDEHLESLGLLIRQALDATDISFRTDGVIARLIVRLLPHHPAWSATWLATLVKERGNVSLSSMDALLTDDDTRRIAPQLVPVLKSWDTRDRHMQLLWFANSFGRRLKVFPELVALLEGLTFNSLASTASAALNTLHTHVRASFTTLVPKLVASDPSWMTQWLVYGHVHQHRQDLLTPFLGRQAYQGRFSTGRTRFVLPILSGFHRWTPSQQKTFRTTLEEVTRDGQRDSPALLQVIQQLAALPEEVSPRLINLADVRNEKLITRDSALRALGQMDAGQGVPTLLAALEDNRSRIAIYALRRALLEMPANRALSLLQGVATEKVTVAKEVVRLLGELRTEASFREILSWNNRPLHRDVRVALLRAMWDFPNRDEAWSILEEAARSDDAAVATMAGRTPSLRLNAASQERLISIVISVLSHPDPKVRCNGLSRCQTMPVVDPQRRLLPSLMKAMSSSIIDEVQAAASAVFSSYDGTHAAAIGQAVNDLLANRRALPIVIAAIQARAYWSQRAMRPIVEQVLNALERDPLTMTLRVRLAVSCEEGRSLVAFLKRNVDDLHPEALMEAVQLISSRPNLSNEETSETNSTGIVVTQLTPAVEATSNANDPNSTHDPLSTHSPDSTQSPVGIIETELKNHPDPRLRRLALAALIAQSTSPRGWTLPLRTRLTEYQSDLAPLVASAATFTFPEELPE